jgi:hypothetical protein
VWLNRARAIADFMQAAGTSGYELWYHGLRGDTGARLGEQTEWPPGSETLKTTWDALEKRLGALPAELTELSFIPLVEAGDALVVALTNDIDVFAGQMRESSLWEDRAAQSEMTNRLVEWRAQAVDIQGDFHMLADEFSTSEQSGEDQVDTSPTEDSLELDSDFEVSETEPDLSTSDIGPTDAQLEDIHSRLEQLGFNAIYETKLLDSFASASTSTMDAALIDLKDFYSEWVSQVKALRTVYNSAYVLTDEWGVSSGPGAARVLPYEPDVEKMCQIAANLDAKNTHGNLSSFADDWRTWYGNY